MIMTYRISMILSVLGCCAGLGLEIPREWGEIWQPVLPAEEGHPCLFFDDSDRLLLADRLRRSPWRPWGEHALKRFPAARWWLLGDTEAAAAARKALVNRPIWREASHGYLEPSSHRFAAYVISYDLLASWDGLSAADHRIIRGKIVAEARYYFDVMSGGVPGGANFGNQRTLGASALGLAALVLCGEKLPEKGPEAWLRQALYEIRRPENFWFFRPGGLFVEGLGYSDYMATQFVPFVIAYERASGHFLFEDERLREWLIFAAYQRLANGEFVMWGTCESGRTLAFYAPLANSRYGRDLQPLFHLAFQQAAPAALGGAFDLLALAEYDPDPGEPLPPPARAFPASQTVVMRCNWGHETVAVWFAGKDPTWPVPYRYGTYSHADASHFVLAAWDEVLAADSGYDHWKSRRHFAADYHNVILVDGVGPAQNTPGLLGGVDLAKNLMRATVTTEYAGCRFRRTLVLVRGRYLVVLDAIEAPAEHEYTWQVRSTCPPDSPGSRLDAHAVTWPGLDAVHWRSHRLGKTQLTTLVPRFANLAVREGTWRPLSGEPDFRNQVALATWRAASCRALFLLIPNRRAEPDVAWERIEPPKDSPAGSSIIRVRGPDWVDEISLVGRHFSIRGKGSAPVVMEKEL